MKNILTILVLFITINDGFTQQPTCLKGDCKNGFGILSAPNGNRYEGNFVNGLMVGQGTLFFANGDKYVGEFANNVIGGKGVFYFGNGTRYEGTFTNGNLTGSGTLYAANGDKYVGEIVNGLMHGTGTYLFANGTKMEGKFANNNYIGSGVFDFKKNSITLKGFLNSLDVSPDGSEVVYSINDSIVVRNLSSNATNKIFDKGMKHIAFSFDGNQVFALSSDSKIKVYNKSDNKVLKMFSEVDSVSYFALSPMGDKVVLVRKEVFYVYSLPNWTKIKTITLNLNKESGRTVEKLKNGLERITGMKHPEFLVNKGLSFSADGKHLFYTTTTENPAMISLEDKFLYKAYLQSLDNPEEIKSISNEMGVYFTCITPTLNPDIVITATLQSIDAWSMSQQRKIKAIRPLSGLASPELRVKRVESMCISPNLSKLFLDCRRELPMTDNDKIDVSTHIIFDMESETVFKDEPLGVGKLYDYKISRNGATVVGQNGILDVYFLYFMNVTY